MSHPIEALRCRIEALNEGDDTLPDNVERLSATRCGSLYHIEFYGLCFGEAYTDLCETLSNPEVAADVLSLSLRGPDEGANGTRNWDLEPLVAPEGNFPSLRAFSVERNQPGNHNRTIIADSFEEAGVIARFAAKCPRLVSLAVPSAPTPEFFGVPLPALRQLSVDAGYDTQHFLRYFARSSGFPRLISFEWGEYSESYVDGWENSCTPFLDYEELFSSPSFATIRRFVLRQPNLSPEQLVALRKLRSGLQLQLVRYSDEYLRA